MAAAGVTLVPTKVTLDQRGRDAAVAIINAGVSVGATSKEILGGLAAGLAETGGDLNKYDVGDNGQAIGVFQQHDSYGTLTQRLDVTTAAKAFFERLKGTRGREGTAAELGTRIADVQRPAAENRHIYGDNLDEALFVFNQNAPLTKWAGSAEPNVTEPANIYSTTGEGGDPARSPSEGATGTGSASGSASGSSGNVQLISKHTPTAKGSGLALSVLTSIDEALNSGGGLFNVQDNAGAIIARTGTVALGVMFGVAGGVLLISAILDSGTARDVKRAAGVIPGAAGGIAAAEVLAGKGNERAAKEQGLLGSAGGRSGTLGRREEAFPE